ncbi:hypothetical protein KZX50_16965 [Bacillus infantis]|uniref:hypothetical protein n=1 Tax=Bacillus infantis TaxID=324767 RepID=UPI0014826C8F|nr:hypothetical protein [Bacillus infantis]MCK6207131.1 hypothetical protein [Bacillus infantis]
MKDSITIGVIGPEWMKEKILHCLRLFPNFHPEIRTSDHIHDAPAFTKELAGISDVLLYSGLYPYSISKAEIPPHLPAHFIPLKGSGLYRALYALKKEAPDIDSISADTLPPPEVSRILKELGEDTDVAFYPQSISFDRVEEITHFHRSLYHAGKTKAAVTGIKIVAEKLADSGIPSEWVIPTEDDIIVTLERALLSTEKRRNRESQIVFGLIQIDSYHELVKQNASEHQIQRLNLRLYRILLDYIELLEGHLTSLNGNEFMFITTRGAFERVTRGYKWIPIIKEVSSELKLKLSLGAGFGLSANEAGTHARIALMQAQDYGGECCFIVKEDRSVFGPVEMDAPISYPLSVTDSKLLQKAEDSGMTAIYLQKLTSLIERKRNNQFTAYELASTLGITARSAHRIILKWMDAGILTVIGMEKISARGRPRQVFRLAEKKELQPQGGPL